MAESPDGRWNTKKKKKTSQRRNLMTGRSRTTGATENESAWNKIPFREHANIFV